MQSPCWLFGAIRQYLEKPLEPLLLKAGCKTYCTVMNIHKHILEYTHRHIHTIGILAILSVVGALFINGSGIAWHTSTTIIPVKNTSSWAVGDAFAQSKPYVHAPKGRVSAGILPHHTLVAPLLAAFFRGIENSPLSTVVIVGPDHGNAGRAYVTTARYLWDTPDRVVPANQELIQTLVDRGVAVYDDALIRREPSVSAVVPYLAHQFPEATVVPLALRGDLRSDKLEQLADVLADLLGPHDLVLASVDFSHYKDIVGARTDDQISLSAIASMDADAALHAPVDSPPSLSLIIRYAQLRGLSYQELVHTNSAEFLHDLTLPSTTSYLTAYFYQ